MHHIIQILTGVLMGFLIYIVTYYFLSCVPSLINILDKLCLVVKFHLFLMTISRCLSCCTARSPACAREHGWPEPTLSLGLDRYPARYEEERCSVARWHRWWYLCLMSEGGCQPPGAAVNKKWMEREGGGARSCCWSSLTLTSLVAAPLLPPGDAVYTILNPFAARQCQVLCNTAPQLLEFSSHIIKTHMKILISETTAVYSWEFRGGWCLQRGWIGLVINKKRRRIKPLVAQKCM